MPVGGARPGAGRPKGVPNKMTRDIRKAVMDAFAKGGGADWLRKQMAENPTAFMTLLGKVLPTQITGTDDGPIEVAAVIEQARKRREADDAP